MRSAWTSLLGQGQSSPSSTQDVDPGRRPEHYLQVCGSHALTTLLRGVLLPGTGPLQEGPVVVPDLDAGLHHARHLGGDYGQRLALQVRIVPVAGDVSLELVAEAFSRSRMSTCPASPNVGRSRALPYEKQIVIEKPKATLQLQPPTRVARIPTTSPGAVRASLYRLASCTHPTCSADHAIRSGAANSMLDFFPQTPSLWPIANNDAYSTND